MGMALTDRIELGNQLPLATPFSLHIFPSFYCNFKCNYCLHSLSKEALELKHFVRQMMDFSTYQKAIDDLTEFQEPLKALIFAGHGEPLTHPKIAEMIGYAEQKQVAKRTEIVTNGSLLTYKLSDQLINAGLKRLRISIQGINSSQYEATCGVSVDFDQLVDQISYFYHNKKDTEVYIKIIDIALKSKAEQEKFYQIFAPISDTTAIEYAIPFVKELDYSNLSAFSGLCKQGNCQHSSICSMPFYMLVLYPSGDIMPCCATDVPKVFGNVKQETLRHIWDGDIRLQFLRQQLNGVSNIQVCQQCTVPAFGLQEGDYLDTYVHRLKPLY